VRAPTLERFRRNDENAPADLWYRRFPQPLQFANVAIAEPRVHREQHHRGEVFRQPLKEAILFFPGNGIRAATGFRQHGYRWRHCLEPWTAVIVPVGASGAIENRAHNLEAPIYRGGRRASREPCSYEGLQRPIMDSVRLKMTNMVYQHAHVPGDGVYRTPVAGAVKITRSALVKKRTSMCLALEFSIDSLDLFQ
jgi:hypothetical protein